MATYTYKNVSFYINETNAAMSEDEFVKANKHHEHLSKEELQKIYKGVKKQFNAAKASETEPVSVMRDAAGKVLPLAAEESINETAVVPNQPATAKPK